MHSIANLSIVHGSGHVCFSDHNIKSILHTHLQVDAITDMIAYPDQILNDTYLDWVYAEVSLLKYHNTHQESLDHVNFKYVSGSQFMLCITSIAIFPPTLTCLHSTTSLSGCSLRMSYSIGASQSKKPLPLCDNLWTGRCTIHIETVPTVIWKNFVVKILS